LSRAPDVRTERPSHGAFSGLELWCVDLENAGPVLHDVEQRTQRLSEQDREGAGVLKDVDAVRERLATRIALRVLIERALGSEWRGVPFERSAHGKPYLAGAPVHFSISHVAGVALIGIASEAPIGVDVERVREVHMRDPRRSRIEAAAVALSPAQPLPAGGEARFLQAWVRLEALAKADGGGIGRLLTRLDIAGRRASPDEGWEARVAEAKAAANVRHLGDLALGSGIFAAAALSERATPQLRWLPQDLEGLEELVG